jgi:predicted RNA-binding Zn-ribbon protein involved in translation (DUF1610 family)
MNKSKYTVEKLQKVVKESTSIAEVMRKLGFKQISGGSFSHLSNKIKKLNIDKSHFKGQSWMKGKTGFGKLSWDKILIISAKGRREPAVRLRRALIDFGKEYKCEICGQLPFHNGKELRLQVDHINKNWLDNRPENVRFVCPNCHTQTDGFNGSKKLTGVTTAIKYKSTKKHTNTNENWRMRSKIKQRKVLRPEYSILLKDVEQLGFCATGRKYGVSDNAIRKWIKHYKGIKTY